MCWRAGSRQRRSGTWGIGCPLQRLQRPARCHALFLKREARFKGCMHSWVVGRPGPGEHFPFIYSPAPPGSPACCAMREGAGRGPWVRCAAIGTCQPGAAWCAPSVPPREIYLLCPHLPSPVCQPLFLAQTIMKLATLLMAALLAAGALSAQAQEAPVAAAAAAPATPKARIM